MSTTLKRISAVCASALLLACANTPADRPAHVPELADASPSERNRYATELAEKGDYAGAIAIWRSLTEANTRPEAYLYRNLGYALLLNGEYDAALGSLEKSCLLDPLNPRGWTHLGSALRKLGKNERAEMMFRQAATLERHETTVDHAMATGPTLPAIVNAVAAPPRPTDDWAIRELDASGGVIDLRRLSAQPVTQAGSAGAPLPVTPLVEYVEGAADAAHVITAPVDMPSTVTPAAAPVQAGEARQAAVRVEVRNGNGVPGMAAATAREIANGGLRVVRLTNLKGFNVGRTRIEYASGFQDAASKLAQRFGDATMVEVDNFWKADMRLVIGKDRVGPRTATVAAKRAPAAKGRESASVEKVTRPPAPPVRG